MAGAVFFFFFRALGTAILGKERMPEFLKRQVVFGGGGVQGPGSYYLGSFKRLKTEAWKCKGSPKRKAVKGRPFLPA